MRAIPGVVVIVLGVLRSVFGSGSSVARTTMTGRPSSEAERRSDSLLPLVFGIGLVIAGFWLVAYALV
jgi:hypothetical protein